MYALASADGVTYYRTNRTDNPTGFNEEDNVNAAYQYKILISVAADYDGGYDFDGTNPDGIAKTVTWTVSGNSSASTTISEGGLADIRRGRRVRVNHDNCDFDSRRN